MGRPHYPLSPEQMAVWVERFINDDGLNLVGGCCGTSTPHIAALDQMLRKRGGYRPHARRAPPGLGAVGCEPLRPDAVAPGEQLLLDWRALQCQWLAEVARTAGGGGLGRLRRRGARAGGRGLEQPGRLHGVRWPQRNRRDGRGDPPFTSSVNAPLVIDSTETPVIESALKLHGGKPIINSINFEDGEGHARDRLILAKKFGAAMIALTIDEAGMAKRPEDKLRIARRLVAFACDTHGLPQSDLLIDPLTLTIATGAEDDRKLGQWTLEGIRAIRDEFPDIQIILGLSNISFGLNAGGAGGAELGVPRPCGQGGHDRRDRPCQQDPAAAPDRARGGAGLRGFDLRPPARGLRPAAEAARNLRRPEAGRRDEEGSLRDRRGEATRPHRRRRPQGADR